MWLMLFSDILLFSRRHGKIFTTMEEQVLLENLLVQDVNCTERKYGAVTCVFVQISEVQFLKRYDYLLVLIYSH